MQFVKFAHFWQLWMKFLRRSASGKGFHVKSREIPRHCWSFSGASNTGAAWREIYLPGVQFLHVKPA